MSDVSEKISTADSTHTSTITVEIPIIPISKNVASLSADNSKASDVVDVGIIGLASDHKTMVTVNDPDRANANKMLGPINNQSTVNGNTAMDSGGASAGTVTVPVSDSANSDQKPPSNVSTTAPETVTTVTTTTMVNIGAKNSESRGNCY